MKELPPKDRLRECDRMYHFVETEIASYGREKAADNCYNYVQTIQQTINTLSYESNSSWIDTLNCRLHYLKQAMSDNGIVADE